MKIKDHHSKTTRELDTALRMLTDAAKLLREARYHLSRAGRGKISAPLDLGTFNASYELNRGRDKDGKPDSAGISVLERLASELEASAARDDAADRGPQS